MTFSHPFSKSDPALVLSGSSALSVSFPRLCLNAVVLPVVFPIHWLLCFSRTEQLGYDPRHQEMQQTHTRRWTRQGKLGTDHFIPLAMQDVWARLKEGGH